MNDIAKGFEEQCREKAKELCEVNYVFDGLIKYFQEWYFLYLVKHPEDQLNGDIDLIDSWWKEEGDILVDYKSPYDLAKKEVAEKELIVEEAILFIASLFKKRLINKMEFKKLNNFILLESQVKVLQNNFKDWIKQLIDPQNKQKLIDARSKFFEGKLDKQEYDFLRAEILGI